MCRGSDLTVMTIQRAEKEASSQQGDWGRYRFRIHRRGAVKPQWCRVRKLQDGNTPCLAAGARPVCLPMDRQDHDGERQYE